MSKALGLLSGGLDSSLAALCLKRQGIEVTAVAFVTPFFGAGKARRAAEKIGIPLLVRDIGEVHLEMVKRPHYGYGKNLNPCIDCHAMMFRLAGETMVEQGFDMLFSGEVLGQRPMSQNLSALRAVAKHSGHPDRILRPLSARLLPVTPMETDGLVDRELPQGVRRHAEREGNGGRRRRFGAPTRQRAARRNRCARHGACTGHFQELPPVRPDRHDQPPWTARFYSTAGVRGARD